MKYGLIFILLALYLATLAVIEGGWALLLLWPALSFLLVGAAYAGAGPRIFGKRPDGRLSLWRMPFLLPFLLFAWTVWHVQRRVSREAPANEVAPGLWLGRRPLRHEVPADVVLVIDLTAEFLKSPGLAGRTYRCLPTLDALVPDMEELRSLVEEAAACQGAVYIHCAQGHGRSGLFTAAVVLARGLANSPDEVVALVRLARPGVRLKPGQRDLLRRLHEARTGSSANLPP